MLDPHIRVFEEGRNNRIVPVNPCELVHKVIAELWLGNTTVDESIAALAIREVPE